MVDMDVGRANAHPTTNFVIANVTYQEAVTMIKPHQYSSFVRNLSEQGAKQALYQLLAFPETRKFITECALDWDNAYNFEGDHNKPNKA